MALFGSRKFKLAVGLCGMIAILVVILDQQRGVFEGTQMPDAIGFSDFLAIRGQILLSVRSLRIRDHKILSIRKIGEGDILVMTPVPPEEPDTGAIAIGRVH